MIKTLCTKKRTSYTQVRFKERDGLVAVEVSSFVDDKQMPESITSYFLNRTVLPKRITTRSIFVKKRMRGLYYTKPQLVKLWASFNNGSDFFNHLSDGKTNALKQIHSPNFNPENVIWFDGYCHMFYRLCDPEFPMSRPYSFDYIGGIRENEWDFDAAKKHLEDHPFVTSIKVNTIPYYQPDICGLRFLDITVLLSQDELNKLVVYYRDEQKSEYWTTRIKDAILSPYVKEVDPLGVKQFYRGDRRDD